MESLRSFLYKISKSLSPQNLLKSNFSLKFPMVFSALNISHLQVGLKNFQQLVLMMGQFRFLTILKIRGKVQFKDLYLRYKNRILKQKKIDLQILTILMITSMTHFMNITLQLHAQRKISKIPISLPQVDEIQMSLFGVLLVMMGKMKCSLLRKQDKINFTKKSD